jgi:ribosomal protein S18 acetylase RimI-like enzyme
MTSDPNSYPSKPHYPETSKPAPNIRVERAMVEQAPLVRDIMLAAFEEYRPILEPPSSSYNETVEDVERAMSEGGAVLAWVNEEPVGSARFKLGPDYLYVGRVAVLPECRGRRVAFTMMKLLEAFAPSVDRNVIRVDVRMVLEGNLSFFRALGFRLVDTYQHPRGEAICATLLKHLDS